jgi:hypothetical protein
MIQRVAPIPAARQITATHHLPGRIGPMPGSSLLRPVIIGPVRRLPRNR